MHFSVLVYVEKATPPSGEASPIFSQAIAKFERLPIFISLEIHCFYGL